MATGLPDLVDCVRLAEESAVVERLYELDDLPRLQDLLADSRGTLRARYAFASVAGRPSAKVTVQATPLLVCQRCMQEFGLGLRGTSEIEFAPGDEAGSADSQRECFRMDDGLVSLRELAEEELLLALPIAPACHAPSTCGKAPSYATGDETGAAAGDMRRPFGALKDLLQKT